MANEITLRKFPKGATIVAIGGAATALYIVVRGEVGISRGSDAVETPPHNVLGPGSFFGESALLPGMRYKGYAHALRDTICVVVFQEKLADLGDTLDG